MTGTTNYALKQGMCIESTESVQTISLDAPIFNDYFRVGFPNTVYLTNHMLKLIEALKERILQNETEIKELKELIEGLHDPITVIKVREIEFNKAKKEINELIQVNKQGIDVIFIAEKLNLDPLVVLKAIDELIVEDKIEKY